MAVALGPRGGVSPPSEWPDPGLWKHHDFATELLVQLYGHPATVAVSCGSRCVEHRRRRVFPSYFDAGSSDAHAAISLCLQLLPVSGPLIRDTGLSVNAVDRASAGSLRI